MHRQIVSIVLYLEFINSRWAQRETQEEKLFYSAGDQALAHIAQRGCGISVFEDFQKPPGHDPEQARFKQPYLCRVVGPGQMFSRGLSPKTSNSVTTCFCDFA